MLALGPVRPSRLHRKTVCHFASFTAAPPESAAECMVRSFFVCCKKTEGDALDAADLLIFYLPSYEYNTQQYSSTTVFVKSEWLISFVAHHKLAVHAGNIVVQCPTVLTSVRISTSTSRFVTRFFVAHFRWTDLCRTLR